MRSDNHKIHLLDVFRSAHFRKFSSPVTRAANFLGPLDGGRGSRGWEKAGGWLPPPGWAPPLPGGGVGSALRKALPTTSGGCGHPWGSDGRGPGRHGSRSGGRSWTHASPHIPFCSHRAPGTGGVRGICEAGKGVEGRGRSELKLFVILHEIIPASAQWHPKRYRSSTLQTRVR